jgi:hypothetical protein
MQAHDVLDHAQPRLMSRVEYDRLVAAGMFENERVEVSPDKPGEPRCRLMPFDRAAAPRWHAVRILELPVESTGGGADKCRAQQALALPF